MKFFVLGLLLLFGSKIVLASDLINLAQQRVNTGSEVEAYYSHICGPQTFLASQEIAEVEVITAENFLSFLENPEGYTARYRQELYDYYITMNGEEQIFKQAASFVLGAAYEQQDVDANLESIKDKIHDMLRGYARNYIVPIHWNFCATSMMLESLVTQYGCHGLAGEELNYNKVNQFCENPYSY